MIVVLDQVHARIFRAYDLPAFDSVGTVEKCFCCLALISSRVEALPARGLPGGTLNPETCVVVL